MNGRLLAAVPILPSTQILGGGGGGGRGSSLRAVELATAALGGRQAGAARSCLFVASLVRPATAALGGRAEAGGRGAACLSRRSCARR